jgi:hypothetical protein
LLDITDLSVYQLNGVNRHQVSRLKRGTVLVNFVGFGNRFLFFYRSGRKAGSYVLASASRRLTTLTTPTMPTMPTMLTTPKMPTTPTIATMPNIHSNKIKRHLLTAFFLKTDKVTKQIN